MEPRYGREAIKSALSLTSDGQLSLTKCAVVVNPDVNNRDFRAILRSIRDNFDPHYDLILLANTAMDTLDFTSFQMNLGSKMIIDATRKPDATASGGKYPSRTENTFVARTGKTNGDLRDIDSRIREIRCSKIHCLSSSSKR